MYVSVFVFVCVCKKFLRTKEDAFYTKICLYCFLSTHYLYFCLSVCLSICCLCEYLDFVDLCLWAECSLFAYLYGCRFILACVGCFLESLKLSLWLFTYIHSLMNMLAMASAAYEFTSLRRTIPPNISKTQNEVTVCIFLLILYIKIRFIRKFKVRHCRCVRCLSFISFHFLSFHSVFHLWSVFIRVLFLFFLLYVSFFSVEFCCLLFYVYILCLNFQSCHLVCAFYRYVYMCVCVCVCECICVYKLWTINLFGLRLTSM